MMVFDTNAVIIAVQGARKRDGASAQSLEDVQAKRAKAFVKNKAGQLAISTITLVEYVSFFPPNQQSAHLAELLKVFRVYPVDVSVAELTASIRHAVWREAEIKQAYEGRRKVFNSDCCIVATAVRKKAKMLVAYDSDAGKILERVKSELKPVLIDSFPEGEQLSLASDVTGPLH